MKVEVEGEAWRGATTGRQAAPLSAREGSESTHRSSQRPSRSRRPGSDALPPGLADDELRRDEGEGEGQEGVQRDECGHG